MILQGKSRVAFTAEKAVIKVQIKINIKSLKDIMFECRYNSTYDTQEDYNIPH